MTKDDSEACCLDGLTQEEFDVINGYHKATRPPKKHKKEMGSKIISFILSSIPILSWLPKYDIKKNLMYDIIGGLTVGIMHVPQGMAYASLAGLKPVNGLYTSFFPPLLYMIFGTSRHVSLGVFAVVSLMTGSCNTRVTSSIISNNSTDLSKITDLSEFRYHTALEVVQALTICVGFVQLLLAILRIDFLTSYLSNQVVNGFTTGAAVHVFVAQLNKILGVSLPRHSGFGKVFYMLSDLTTSIARGEANYVTFGISLFTIVILFAAKELLDPIVKKCCKLPIPYDLFVMIIGTLLSTLFHLNEKYGVKVIGEIPTGLPNPSLPNPKLFPLVVGDAVAIAIVVIVVTVSMGKLFAKKHEYEVDVRQEFYALGIMETVCSFFPVWPSSTALARTLVYEAAGTKSQLATVFSSLLLLLVIMVIGTWVECLPVCLLSCIIIVALKGMFMQTKVLPKLWREFREDFIVFVVTMVATACWDVVEGLACGVATSLALILYKIQSGQIVELGCLADSSTMQFRPLQQYENCEDLDGVKIIQINTPLISINAERYRSAIDSCTEKELAVEFTPSNEEDGLKEAVVPYKEDNRKLLILDLSRLPFVDSTGANTLIQLIRDFKKSGKVVRLANPSHAVIRYLEKVAVKGELSSVIYPSITNALYAEKEQ